MTNRKIDNKKRVLTTLLNFSIGFSSFSIIIIMFMGKSNWKKCIELTYSTGWVGSLDGGRMDGRMAVDRAFPFLVQHEHTVSGCVGVYICWLPYRSLLRWFRYYRAFHVDSWLNYMNIWVGERRDGVVWKRCLFVWNLIRHWYLILKLCKLFNFSHNCPIPVSRIINSR